MAAIKILGQFRLYAVLLLAFQLLTRLSLADHLPANLLARSKPESALAGISIRKPYVALYNLELLWGSPAKTDSQSGNPCERAVTWQRGTVTITGSVGCEITRYGKRYVVYTVEITGTDARRKLGTGRGLCLGDSFERILKLYGSRLWVDRKGEGTSEVLIQWPNGTELNASIDRQNHVSRIQLLPEVE